MQRTLGIVPFNTKSEIISNFGNNDLRIVSEKKFELSIAAATDILNKDGIKEPQIVFGFILEGMNAIQDWLNIISTSYSTKSLFHGSSTPDNARREIDWFQTIVPLSDSSSTLSSKSTTSTSSIPVMVNNNTTTSRRTLLKKPTTAKPTTAKGASVSGTTSPHQRKRDTASADEPRLRKPLTPNNTAVRSKIPPPSTTLKSRTSSPAANRTSNAANTTATKARLASNTANTTATTAPPRRSDINSRRKSLVTTTANINNTAKKLSTTTKGGVSKNTPPASIITGRTRKYSKLTEKRPVGATAKPKKEIPVVDTEKEEKKEELETEKYDAVVVPPTADEETIIHIIQPEIVGEDKDINEENVVDDKFMKEQTADDEAIAIVDQGMDSITETEDKLNTVTIKTKEDDIITHANVLTQQPVSHPSTCSSSADEHDAEVAATISNTNKNNNTVKVAANFFQNTGGRSSSFSPNSVSSLPRPETPEVDQLRQRFETLIQTSAPNTPHDHIPSSRRPSSKMSSEYIISRIKEMKPKDPVGSKVKSMVELFMDENLNKWEF